MTEDNKDMVLVERQVLLSVIQHLDTLRRIATMLDDDGLMEELRRLDRAAYAAVLGDNQ